MSARISAKKARELGLPVPPAPSKYRSKRTEGLWFGAEVTFDSAKEAARAQELQLLQKVGKIEALERQVDFPLLIRGEGGEVFDLGSYRADFSYLEVGERVIEDVKSEVTRKLPVYRLKKKLMRALCGVEIKEV